jgi:hypothetical protein
LALSDFKLLEWPGGEGATKKPLDTGVANPNEQLEKIAKIMDFLRQKLRKK